MSEAEGSAAAKVLRQEASVAGVDGVEGENWLEARKERDLRVVP